MGSVNISHDELNGRSEQHAKRKSSKRILVTALAFALIVGAVIFLVVGVNSDDKERDKDVRTNRLGWGKSTSNAVKDACSSTLHPELCLSSLLGYGGLSSKAGPMEIVNAAVSVGILAVEKAKAHARSLSRPGLDVRQRGALQDCMEMFDDTLDELYDTLSDLHNMSFLSMPKHAADLETLLSAAITNQYTCLEGFHLCKGHLKQDLNGQLRNISNLVSNSLAMVCNITDGANQALGNVDSLSNRQRRLLSERFIASDGDGFPSWMSAVDRRLLQAPARSIRINAVVAKDGSGHYRSISAAVAAAPEKSQTRYVIHIKKGLYEETVDIHKNKHNIMFIGDGKGLTVVTGSRNVLDGSTTFHSATVAVTGKQFIARDMTFQNTAGAAKHQAVALRVGSDLSAFYRCSIKGYQDTLYVHSLRQFYRDCDIHGTVDFIFGNAAVVLQNCNLMARRPSAGQKIMYTAQGREDPNQNTGISIHKCTLTADSDLAAVKRSFQAYLGRPWKQYSRTVIMQSYLDDLIQPAGWHEWAGNFALNTLYYGEYMNTGPGAGTANRVKWRGHHVLKTPTEASPFTVGQFIQGNSWLPSTGVQYSSGLI
uniref:Pectinesterase n=1 Tax=Cunninghamia lanceolata TaxID=28977 RepID=A0A6G9W3I4_CUNLA|nr:pectin methylesterase 24 [Cunninghamia lanceolata]